MVEWEKECAMKRNFFSVFPIMLATAFSASSAFTLTGTVIDESNSPVSGALVKLLVRGDSTATIQNGTFTIHQDDKSSLPNGHFVPGHISVNDGILHFAQSSGTPVQVSIFDMTGNLVLQQDLFGSGQVDLRQGVSSQGTYFAKIRVGNAVETVRFTSNGSQFNSIVRQDRSPRALLKADEGDTLLVVATGFDTSKVPLSNLDTNITVTLKLPAPPTTQTYAFGYGIGNAPTPSKGCGKDNTLKDNFKFTGGGIEHEIYLTMPENYDKNKPYRLVFGMHYMGGSAKNVATREAYYGLRNQSGAKENTIFVAPHGYTTETDRSGKETENPWRCGDDKDHVFFDEFLTYLNENLCVDTSRVFSVGFSFGAMFSNSLAQDFQDRLRGVVVFATMDQVIYLPKNKGLPIAWMGTVGMGDELCTPKLGRSARDRILKNNGKPDADGNFTDARGEEAEEYTGGKHVCYDYKTVDPRFPVKWCTFDGNHTYNASDDGKVWTTPTAWEFITQF